MRRIDAAFSRRMFNRWPVTPPPKTVSEFVQGKRLMPRSSPHPGSWDSGYTPYLVEIMDDLSESSPIQHSITMKARKIGVTAAAENVVLYWMFACPTEVEYVSANEKLIKDWSQSRLDAAIDSMGFRELISQQYGKRGARTGDTTFMKEYPGGRINIVAAFSLEAKRAADKRVLIRDEIDGRPKDTTTGEGNWLEINFAHTNSWGARRKVMDLGSPTTFEDSNIRMEYELGDCRLFFVPCPHCTTMQALELMTGDMKYGLTLEKNAKGEMVGVYRCISGKCPPIFNHHKTEMLMHGQWRPTKKSSSPTLRSRQISALYAPVGMIDWTEICEGWQSAQEADSKLRVFTNTILGLPYKETGGRPKLEHVESLRGTYREGTIPGSWTDHWTGPLYLTAGIDVQRGSLDLTTGDIKNPDNPPRVEMEIMGTGRGYRTWSITYKVFTGDIRDAFSGAWESLYQWAGSHWEQMCFKSDAGRQFWPELILIDSGDGMMVEPVYRFCSRWERTLPSKGFRQIEADPEQRETGINGTEVIPYRRKRLESGVELVEINTQLYKRGFYATLNHIQRAPLGQQPPGYCDFPESYTKEYFAQLVSEAHLNNGVFDPQGRRNEALDCRIMAICAAHVFLDHEMDKHREWGRRQGAPETVVRQWKSTKVLDALEAKIRAAQT